MNKIEKIGLLSNIYHLLSKYGGVIEDMADRVFYSLTTSLDGQGGLYYGTEHEPWRFMEARRHLVPSMERLCNGVIGECMREARDNFMVMCLADANTKKLLLKEVNRQFARGNKSVVLDKLISIFGDFEWKKSFGGKAWKNIASRTKDLYLAIEMAKHHRAMANFYKDKNPKMLEESISLERKALDEMILSANTIDGIAHNTNLIIQNLAQEERLSPEEFGKLEQLMDSKELKDWRETRDVVLPLMRYNDPRTGKFNLKQDGFRDFMEMDPIKKDRFSSDPQKVQKDLLKIRLSKLIEMSTISRKDKIIEIIDGSSSCAQAIPLVFNNLDSTDSAQFLLLLNSLTDDWDPETLLAIIQMNNDLEDLYQIGIAPRANQEVVSKVGQKIIQLAKSNPQLIQTMAEDSDRLPKLYQDILPQIANITASLEILCSIANSRGANEKTRHQVKEKILSHLRAIPSILSDEKGWQLLSDLAPLDPVQYQEVFSQMISKVESNEILLAMEDMLLAENPLLLSQIKRRKESFI